MPPQPRSSAGDALPQQCQVIEIRVAELRQLFNEIDPSPFRQRDLDPRAEEFIVDWASDLPMDKPGPWWCIWTARRGEPTRLRPCERRFTNISVSESRCSRSSRAGRRSSTFSARSIECEATTMAATPVWSVGCRTGADPRLRFVESRELAPPLDPSPDAV